MQRLQHDLFVLYIANSKASHYYYAYECDHDNEIVLSPNSFYPLNTGLTTVM